MYNQQFITLLLNYFTTSLIINDAILLRCFNISFQQDYFTQLSTLSLSRQHISIKTLLSLIIAYLIIRLPYNNAIISTSVLFNQYILIT
ncbi:hypothetical protein MOUN0_O00122 [Monosporozyma unispora]